MRVVDDNVDKVAAMKENYEKWGLTALLLEETAPINCEQLSQEGLNVIGLPKTIDNDIFGTDFTFGFIPLLT